MRRWLTAAAALAALGVLAGCGPRLPAGVDADLADGWRPPPAATQWRPVAGTCHVSRADFVTESQRGDLPCEQTHSMETVFVGDLPAAVTDEDEGSVQAYRACLPKVNAFLGDDYRNGWVIVQPVLPSNAAWLGGARWFRCDVGEMSKVNRSVVERKGSLKALLRAGGPLRQGCYDADLSKVRMANLRALSCAQPHNTEFTGFYTANSPTNQVPAAAAEAGCRAVIARFAAVPNDKDFKYRTGWLSVPAEEGSWGLGDHTVRCYIWLDKEKVTLSFRGGGPNRLRIHYG